MLIVTDDIAIPEELLEEVFTRAGGPGGQHVNKVSSAVQLRFHLAGWQAGDPDLRARVARLAGRRCDAHGWITITARCFRQQDRNRTDARQRLAELIRRALPTPRKRRPTRPSRRAVECRLGAKWRRHRLKTDRRPIDPDRE